MLELQVIEEPATAVVALDPERQRLLAELGAPASAAMLAERLQHPRQKVNYHLRALERHGLVVPAGERRWGGLVERLMTASARSYVISPAALGVSAVSPERHGDRLSARFTIALCARVIREVGDLLRRAGSAEQKVPTLGIDTEIRFADAEARAAFSAELAHLVTTLVARHHDDTTPGGRRYRLIVAAHPKPDEESHS